MSLPLYPSLPVCTCLPCITIHHLEANHWLCTSRWNWLQEGSIPLYHACLSTAPPLPNASCPSLFCSATKPTKTWNSLGTDFSVLLDPSESSKPLFKMYKYNRTGKMLIRRFTDWFRSFGVCVASAQSGVFCQYCIGTFLSECTCLLEAPLATNVSIQYLSQHKRAG